MAARVNVKFVILLSVVLIGAMGAVVWAAMTVVLKSGEDHANRAREFESAGNWVEAEKSWSKAVNHDPARLEWLEAWRRSLESINFPTNAEYLQEFGTLRTILQQVADVKGADFEAHEESLSTISVWLNSMSPSLEALNVLDTATRRATPTISWPDPSEADRLRRYRGQYGARLFATGADLAAERVDEFVADLTAALEADPTDFQSLFDLYLIRNRQAEIAVRDRRTADAERILAEARAKIDEFARANPENLRARALTVGLALDSELEQVDRLGLFGPDLVAAKRRVADKYTDRARELAAMHADAPAEQTDAETTNLLSQLLLRTDREDSFDRVVALWNKAAENRPDDVSVLRQRAGYLKRLGRFAQAIEGFKQIASLERPPVSARGLVLVQEQQIANWQIADAAIEQWLVLPAQAPTREQWLADARQYRELAGQDLPEESVQLTLLDAKLAFADGDYNAADRLIRKFNTVRGEVDIDAVRLAAEIASRLNNTGEQRRLLYRALAIEPTALQAIIPLADIATRLRDYDEAERLLSIASDLMPDNETIASQLSMMRALAGNAQSDDPIQQAIVRAQLLNDEGNLDGAVAALEDAYASASEEDRSRLYLPLASRLLTKGNYERAAEIADAGLAAQPGSTALNMIKREADLGGDATLAEAFIDQSDLPESEKWLRKHRIRLAGGDFDSATEAITKARELAPNDPSVLLLAFEHALRTGNLDDARSISRDHADKDLDGANGLVLRGRIHIADGQFEEAERSLLAAVERGSQNPNTLRMLAQVQLQRGNQIGALDNFARALELRPNDTDFVTGYLEVLAELGRYAQALEVARDSLDFARSNPRFRQVWLTIEGVSGSKQLAYDERVKIAALEPDNQENTAELIKIAIDLRKFDEARELLDTARQKGQSLALVQLDARWHAERNDLAGAVKQFTDFLISDAPGATSASAYIAFGTFLLERGQIDRGLTTLRQGRAKQDPANPVIDRAIGAQLFRLGRFDEAIAVLESIVDGPAADTPIATESMARLVEAYTRTGNWDAAQARIDQLDASTREQLIFRMLQSTIAEGKGQTTEARRIMNETIAAYPEAPMPYIRRATSLLTEPALVNDAIEDLTRAIELDPSNVTAYRIRSGAYAQIGRMNDAVNDVLAAVAAAPDDNEIRVSAAQRLIELEREESAADVIDAGLQRSAGNLQLLVTAGEMFAAIDRPVRAAQYFGPAWQQTKDPTIGARLVRMLLDQPRPDIRQARQVAGDQSLDATDVRVQMMRAQVEQAAGNTAEVERLLIESYKLVKDDPAPVIGWASQLPEMLGSREAALSFVSRLNRAEPLSPWGTFAWARLLASEEDGRAEALRLLSQMIDGSQNQTLRLQSIRLRSLVYYQQEDYTRAVEDMRAGIAMSPDDPEMHNNLAYTLSKHLNRAEEAVPVAERAVELSPDNRGSLDTLGLTYIRAGRPEAALAPLERALALSSADAQKIPVLIHLAEARLETGNTTGARDAAEQAGAMLSELPDASDDWRDELDGVLDKIRNR